MKKKICLLVAATAAVSILVGCSPGAAGGEPSASEGRDPTTVRVWLAGQDTPQAAIDHLTETFAERHPDVELLVERQSWSGLVEVLTDRLSGGSHRVVPDVVEMGNTQVAALDAGGLLAAITPEQYEELGGDDLLPGFVEAGTYDGVLYALPYYAGSRVIFYSEQLLGDRPVPETLDELVDTAVEMRTGEFSGMWMPGRDWYSALPFIWENGGYVARQRDDGTWDAGFSSPGGIRGMEQVQRLMTSASNAPAGDDGTNLVVPFCAGIAGFVSAPTWLRWEIQAPEEPEGDGAPGCASTYGKDLRAIPLPGSEPGEVAPVFAGGSNIAMAEESANPELAYEVMRIMLGDGYQTILAENGLIPGRRSLADAVDQSDPIAAAGVAAAQRARLTPATPKWGDIEDHGIIPAAFARLASGADPAQVAKDLDAQIESMLNWRLDG
ncbi:extracellular solute-binding protein [Myceligenerans pegani]|uniref:Extracellular solute-binding protein n=1 Tax=Myceligenerans pegani TaxID=2776917 RepID=A0ABR9N1M1_9MICO|nr:extracellular solute-binding protein [Myceligenerans sp. TRM 65318]MBE1877181.1 extracellular solute-binding protein [Myceligenerans sp. TRM 65318]MBE3019452.1 extracellular solute-binding protein [Myceligenerans sp. TRM 65318]